MSVGALTSAAVCGCDGSGWIVSLDRSRYAPGEGSGIEALRCSCLEGVRATTVALVHSGEAAARLAPLLDREGFRLNGSFDTVVDLLDEGGAHDVVAVSWQFSNALERKRLRRGLPGARLIALLDSDAPRSLREALDEGVDGAVLESEASRTLVVAVEAVASGQIVMPRSAREQARRPVLSAREKQTLGLVVMGFTNAEIAARLHLSESTIKSHLSSAFHKLGVRSRNEAAALILDAGSGLGTGILSLSS